MSSPRRSRRGLRAAVPRDSPGPRAGAAATTAGVGVAAAGLLGQQSAVEDALEHRVDGLTPALGLQGKDDVVAFGTRAGEHLQRRKELCRLFVRSGDRYVEALNGLARPGHLVERAGIAAEPVAQRVLHPDDVAGTSPHHGRGGREAERLRKQRVPSGDPVALVDGEGRNLRLLDQSVHADRHFPLQVGDRSPLMGQPARRAPEMREEVKCFTTRGAVGPSAAFPSACPSL